MERLTILLAVAASVAACRSTSPVDRGETRAPPVNSSPRAAAGPSPAQPSATSSAPAIASASPPARPALAADAPMVELAVEGHGNAVVSLPLGATSKRPVMVALHGNYDRPEWQCEVWRGITRGHPFILCPRGIPRGDAPKAEDRWTYGALGKVREELDRGLAALKLAYPDHVDDGPVMFTGFSLGAILGVHILRKDPARWERAVLTEGGYKGWGIGVAKALSKAGMKRVLFACGQTACKHAGREPARWLDKAGVPSKVAYGGQVGHTYDGPVARAIVEEWGWLTEGDDRWVETK